MKRFRQRKKSNIVCLLIISTIFFIMFCNVKGGYTSSLEVNNSISVLINDDNEEAFKIPQNFQIIEYSEIVDNEESVTSINVELPDSTWNITDIELNFTNIKLNKQVKTIEDTVYSSFKYIYDSLWDGTYYLGVQINITEPTTIFGAYIYGRKSESTFEPINISLTGFDEDNNKPTLPIYHEQELYISTEEDWYFQNFSKPITLSEGAYYLLLDGSNVQDSETIYYWAFNQFDPKYPNLYSSEYNGYSWSIKQGEPFLYKLVQKVNKTYFPEDILMKTELNEVSHEILNGETFGSGFLSLTDLNISCANEILQIPITNNDSAQLIFNISYCIKMSKFSYSSGEIMVRINSDIEWCVTQNLNILSNSHTLKFYYPKSWVNLNIDVDGVNVTKDVLIKEKQGYLMIFNNLIKDRNLLNITAKSQHISFPLNVPKTEFESGEELKFSIEEPVLDGQYFFLLVDPLGFEEYKEIRYIPHQNNTFEYSLLSPNEGIWTAYICWNNETDAGLQSQTFSIYNPSSSIVDNNVVDINDDNDSIVSNGITPQFFFLILATIIIGLFAGMTSYQMVRIKKGKITEKQQKIFHKYMDILNLNYIIILEKNSGLNIYEQVFSGNNLDVTLISGFLEAIRSFGIEFSGTEEQSQTIKLEYQKSKILMSEYKSFRIVNIMEESPSQEFLDSLEPLARDIDKAFSNSLENFSGKRKPFEGIRKIIEKHLQISLIYPLKVVAIKDMETNHFKKILSMLSIRNQKILINKAQHIMKQQNSDHFYVSHLMDNNEFNPKKAENILKLITKNIFQPIT